MKAVFLLAVLSAYDDVGLYVMILRLRQYVKLFLGGCAKPDGMIPIRAVAKMSIKAATECLCLAA